ncbi:phospho-2-dehydro-3-deoxyheptonate aldolase [Candidatus Tremblaya phenacola PAVE]|nr:phospho-2-dehydro-3-deoxyheptonate aldolase [Candidatus Tremblaya phenacola PAVE]
MKQKAPPSISPRDLMTKLRADWRSQISIGKARQRIKDIIRGKSERLLVIIGPCSILDVGSSIEYCKALSQTRNQLSEVLEIVMRVYVEKPRTVIGWKGISNDPFLDGSFEINKAIEVVRRLMLQLSRYGIPLGSECLSPLLVHYVSDLLSWGSVGARNTESQIHREMASSLTFPFGFKNRPDGDSLAAINSIQSSSTPHHYLSVGFDGKIVAVRSEGNDAAHLILRGGLVPNYDVTSVKAVREELRRRKEVGVLIIDASHANSQKDSDRQLKICEEIVRRRTDGEEGLGGVMIESNLKKGRQDLSFPLEYGISVTDPCISWKESRDLLFRLADAVQKAKSS